MFEEKITDLIKHGQRSLRNGHCCFDETATIFEKTQHNNSDKIETICGRGRHILSVFHPFNQQQLFSAVSSPSFIETISILASLVTGLLSFHVKVFT